MMLIFYSRVRVIIASVFLIFLLMSWAGETKAQQSVARKWNEALLEAIRGDFARPTVHARNLYHTSMAVYDAWAVYDDTATPYFLTNSHGTYHVFFAGIIPPANLVAAQEEAMSYAAYRILMHRFESSPSATPSLNRFDSLLTALGYDKTFVSEDYENGPPAALGNYIAAKVIEFGLQDGANEENGYANQYYTIVNLPIAPANPGNPGISDPNRWQPISLESFIDQSGNPIPGSTQPFLGPEWGNVLPFALAQSDLTEYMRDNNPYRVYKDPGPPPYIESDGSGLSSEYQWGFTLVSKWSSHLDPADNVMIDISPATIGNIQSYPTTIEGLRDFYDETNGGDTGIGYTVNPKTGAAYVPQMVPRADYARVLAEFWADGPDSETPPGHWFTILNYVSDHPLLEKIYMGEGAVLDDLEWDVKAYFMLAGAMHDAAVSAWGIKGWYDYTRPVSAIRYMADQGQSSDPVLPNYDPAGIPLTKGLVELVEAGDPLAGPNEEHLDKIKVYAWKGPDFISDPDLDVAGVDWILAENWWPYQRPTFVTPPFAGYISGHSTFSRAAAEILTKLTGDQFFPGGLGEFEAKANEFLVFEDGPSVDILLQWATYRDASDQTSLSRIWGGIHPPVDDIPGRLIGEEIGLAAFDLADQYFNGLITAIQPVKSERAATNIFPNPVKSGNKLYVQLTGINPDIQLWTVLGVKINIASIDNISNGTYSISTKNLSAGIYIIKIRQGNTLASHKVIIE